MRVELWVPGQPIGHFSAEEAIAIQGQYTGPMVAVIDEQGRAAIIQPMNPDTGENWESEEDAMAFGYRYLNPPPVEQNVDRLEDPRRRRMIDASATEVDTSTAELVESDALPEVDQ